MEPVCRRRRRALPPSGGPKRGARGDPAIPFPPRRAGLRRRGPHSFLRIAATLRIAGRATRGMPRAPDPGAKTNLRGVAAHAARWGGAGRTTGIGFLHSPSLQRAPSNPPALGLGGRRGHTRRPRELAGAVGEGATPCTDGRPPENTPAWIASHQSSLPNAAKGYPPREPRERDTPAGLFTAPWQPHASKSQRPLPVAPGRAGLVVSPRGGGSAAGCWRTAAALIRAVVPRDGAPRAASSP